MKLNFNCIHDILLEVENFEFGSNVPAVQIINKYSDRYTEDDMYNSFKILYDADLIKAVTKYRGEHQKVVRIKDLTVSGHMFLDALRTPSQSKKLKDRILSIGTLTAPIIQNILSELAISKFNF